MNLIKADEAATIQAYAAIAQTFLGVVIGGATLYFGRMANMLLRLQTETQIAPSVSLDLHPWVALDTDEPLNYVQIKNFSPLELTGITLSAEIFGHKAGCPTERQPAIWHMGELPDMPPKSDQLRCIDEFVDEALKLLKIGPDESSVIKGVMTVHIRLHLSYRRKSDGAGVQEKLLIGVLKSPQYPRAMAVYADYRSQLPGSGGSTTLNVLYVVVIRAGVSSRRSSLRVQVFGVVPVHPTEQRARRFRIS
jgi:hypothetical protein